jgi:hypothetical protein
MAISLVQSVGSTPGAAQNSTPVTLGSTTTGNNLYVFFAEESGSSINSITCTGATFSSTGISVISSQGKLEVWYASNITGATTPTLTVNLSASTAACPVIVREYSGLVSYIDQIAQTAVNANPATSPNIPQSTSLPSSLLIGAFVGDNNSHTISAGTGYGNFLQQNGGNGLGIPLAAEDQIVSAKGIYSASVVNPSGTATVDIAIITIPASVAHAQFNNSGLRPHSFSPGLAR